MRPKLKKVSYAPGQEYTALPYTGGGGNKRPERLEMSHRKKMQNDRLISLPNCRGRYMSRSQGFWHISISMGNPQTGARVLIYPQNHNRPRQRYLRGTGDSAQETNHQHPSIIIAIVLILPRFRTRTRPLKHRQKTKTNGTELAHDLSGTPPYHLCGPLSMSHVNSSPVRVQHAHAVLLVHDTMALLAPVLGILLPRRTEACEAATRLRFEDKGQTTLDQQPPSGQRGKK